MTESPARIIAVDWSGRLQRPERAIWLAEVADGRVVRLESGRNRDELIDELTRAAETPGRLVIGLDFSFSVPSAFLTQHAGSARAFWDVVARDGERWLAGCSPPFWGRPGVRRHDSDLPSLRRTERVIAESGIGRPSSVFQIGGVGSVGTGSLRGMPFLRQLADAGCAIWPFDDPAERTVVEIYPRLFTPGVVKSRPAARAEVFEQRFAELPTTIHADAIASEDAFDALMAAVGMAAWADRPEAWVIPEPEAARVEGWIWPAFAGWRDTPSAGMVPARTIRE